MPPTHSKAPRFARAARAPAPTTGLDRLVAAEARLATLLAGAEDAAAEALEQARAVAAGRVAALEAGEERALAGLAARIAAETQAQQEAIAADADGAVRRYEAVGAAEVEALAAEVVARLLGAEGAP